MSESTCNEIAELLVDYADGELSPADASRVEAHLATCGDCRGELDRLRRSLAAAKAIWSEAASGVSAPESRPIRPRRRIVPIAAAAACLAVVAAVAAWLLLGLHRTNDGPTGAPPRQVVETPQTDFGPDENNDLRQESVPDLREIESQIARAGRSARLAVSADLLSTRSELQPYRKQADRYLAAVYPDTAAGSAAAARIDDYPRKEPKS